VRFDHVAEMIEGNASRLASGMPAVLSLATV
jgi:hypothetical protein